MKKLILSGALLLFAFCTYAQQRNARNHHAILTPPSNPTLDAAPSLTEEVETETHFYELEFWMDGVEYTGLLVMQGGEGRLRVHYETNGEYESCQIIEETMQLSTTEDGVVYLAGSNPVNVRTQHSSNYAADNIVLSKSKTGEPQFFNVDGQGRKAAVSMQLIRSQSRLRQLMSFYEW